jgi:hypothetical protein
MIGRHWLFMSAARKNADADEQNDCLACVTQPEFAIPFFLQLGLLVTQRHCGINMRGSSRWNITRSERNCGQEHIVEQDGHKEVLNSSLSVDV